ncbi:MAG: septum formation initiator family protein [Deltaproteobacteria bacterium]|nr:septum formation initiator family protein [Deltaproteobacteria bacterium]MBW2417037.1 septum formation initiator family protein [Deltaproteobacteria bacterium]
MSRSSASAQPSRRLQLLHLLETLAGPSKQRDAARCRDLVGIDVADGRLHARPTFFLPLLIAILVAALFIVGLRSELTAMRYAIPEALAQEEQLRAEKRALTVEMRRLRDPGLLAARAREMGFVRPEHIIDLPAAAGRGETQP